MYRRINLFSFTEIDAKNIGNEIRIGRICGRKVDVKKALLKQKTQTVMAATAGGYGGGQGAYGGGYAGGCGGGRGGYGGGGYGAEQGGYYGGAVGGYGGPQGEYGAAQGVSAWGDGGWGGGYGAGGYAAGGGPMRNNGGATARRGGRGGPYYTAF
jgi:hypothetical protein